MGVLKAHGVFFIVSYGVPDNRLQYLENEDYSWSVSVHTVPKPTVSATAVPDTKDANSVHYIYVCQKGGTADEGELQQSRQPRLSLFESSTPQRQYANHQKNEGFLSFTERVMQRNENLFPGSWITLKELEDR